MTKEQEEIIEFLKNEIKTGDLMYGTGSDIWFFKEMLQDTLNLIQEQQTELEKKDKIIGLMAETIIEDTSKLDTFWCNGCTEIIRCKYNNNVIACIKQYFERKIEEWIKNKC